MIAFSSSWAEDTETFVARFFIKSIISQGAPAVDLLVRLETGFRDFSCLHLAAKKLYQLELAPQQVQHSYFALSCRDFSMN